MACRVLVPLAQGCEELEAVTICDVLTRAGIEVMTASLDEQRHIHASRGMQLVAATSLQAVSAADLDAIVLPGGMPGSDHLNDSDVLRKLLQNVAHQGGLCAAICAAPKVLVSAGLLNHKDATSFPGVIDQCPAEGMRYLDDAVVEDGQIVTSRSAGTALAFSLVLVERLMGKAVRDQVQSGLLP